MTRSVLLALALAPLTAGCGDEPPKDTAPVPPVGDKFQKAVDKTKVKPGGGKQPAPAPKVGCLPVGNEPAVGWQCPSGHATPTRSSI